MRWPSIQRSFFSRMAFYLTPTARGSLRPPTTLSQLVGQYCDMEITTHGQLGRAGGMEECTHCMSTFSRVAQAISHCPACTVSLGPIA